MYKLKRARLGAGDKSDNKSHQPLADIDDNQCTDNATPGATGRCVYMRHCF